MIKFVVKAARSQSYANFRGVGLVWKDKIEDGRAYDTRKAAESVCVSMKNIYGHECVVEELNTALLLGGTGC